MTPDVPQLLLTVTAVSPIVGALATLITSFAGGQDLGRIIRRFAYPVTILSGGVLTTLLLLNESENPEPISLPNLDWLSFSGLQTFRISFGLTTTWVQSLAVSVCGLLTWVATETIAVRSTNPRISNPATVLVSLLYAAGTVYLFAPNVAQALLGWLAVTYFAFLLFRLSSSMSQDKGNRSTSLFAARSIDQKPWKRTIDQIEFAFEYCREHVWAPVTKVLPEWIGEQLKLIETETPSFQFVAVSLAATAILLTWLIAP